MIWKKSRIRWNADGDENTKYFHYMVNKNRQRNNIIGLFHNNHWIVDPTHIKSIFFNHFNSFLNSSQGHTTFQINTLSINTLPEHIKDSLEKMFTKEEIALALNEIDPNKSLGLDGLNAGCIKQCWSLFKPGFEHALSEFHRNGTIPHGLNSSFIALIPKFNNPSKPSDFRPISLINSTMKLILKILANRLKEALPHIISDEKTGFMQDRNISDGIIITSEIIHSIHVNKNQGVILKLDFKKAFDKVNWDFLYDALRHMNFGSKWIMWTKSIFETIRIAVLVNGSPTNEFMPSRGLRQGDPLSPLFFNIVGQIFHHLITEAHEQGLFKGIQIGQDEKKFTHLQFADDTILFINGNDTSISSIKRILIIFQLLSGLKINFNKSELFANNYTQQ